jgi:hypothetical protein
MFKVVEEKIKQSLRLMDDDKTNMQNIKYEGANENMTTIENNFNKKTKQKRIKKILTKAMTTHSRIILKKYNNFPFLNTFEFRLDSNE